MLIRWSTFFSSIKNLDDKVCQLCLVDFVEYIIWKKRMMYICTYIIELSFVSFANFFFHKFNQRSYVIEFSFFEYTFFDEICLEDQFTMPKITTYKEK